MKKVYLKLRKTKYYIQLKHKSSENGHLRICPCRCSVFLRELNAVSLGTIRPTLFQYCCAQKLSWQIVLSTMTETVLCQQRGCVTNEDRKTKTLIGRHGYRDLRLSFSSKTPPKVKARAKRAKSGVQMHVNLILSSPRVALEKEGLMNTLQLWLKSL